MASSRRPPPPPPMENSPPPLPSRNDSTGNRQLMEPINPPRSLPGLPVSLKTVQRTTPEKTQTRPLLPGAENVQINQRNVFLNSRDSFNELGSHISGNIKGLPLGKSQSFGKERKISLLQKPLCGSLFNRDVKCGEKQRRVTTGDSLCPQMQDDEDAYEQPTPHSSSDISAAARCGAINTSSIQRISAAENSDSEGWSDSEWEDCTNLDAPSTPQSDDTYLLPDGGMIPDNYNILDDTHVSTKETFKQSNNAHIPQMTLGSNISSIQSPITSKKLPTTKITANGSKEDKKNKTEIKSSETNIPKTPPKNTHLGDQHKPVPKPKPLKPSDPIFPKLPPRPKEKPLPAIPSVPPLGLVDITCTSSVSSGSVICPSKQEVHNHMPDQYLKQKSRVLMFPHMHEDLKRVTENIIANKHQAVKPLPSVTDTPIYDDGVSEVLSSFDWFHGELEREEGAKRVKQLSENGTFLIRASKTDGTNSSHPYTLVVTLDKKVYNLKIRQRPDSRYAIGNYKSEEVSFSTVPELVEHHKENNIKLSEGGAVKLTCTPKK